MLNKIDPETMMDRRNKTDTTHAIHIEHMQSYCESTTTAAIPLLLLLPLLDIAIWMRCDSSQIVLALVGTGHKEGGVKESEER